MTPQERNEAWLKLEKMYRPYLDLENMPFYGRGAGWQRQNHIYATPFYYIDYCLAQTVALQFWLEIEKDWKQAWEKYKMFVKRGGTDTFLGLVEGAGLAQRRYVRKDNLAISESYFALLKEKGFFNN